MSMFRKKRTVDALRGDLEAAKASLTKAEAAVAEIEATRRIVAVEGGPEERAVFEKRLVTANADAEWLRDKIAGLEEALQAAEAEAEQERRRKLYNAAQQFVACAPGALKKYEEHARAICEVLETIANVEVACARANQQLPAGAQPIPSAEMLLRGRPGRDEKVLSAQTVELWCDIDGKPVADQRVFSNGKTATRYRSGDGFSATEYLTRRRFRRERVQERVLANWPASLARTIVLPAVHVGERPFWDPNGADSPTSILDQANRNLEPRADEPDVIVERLISLADDEAAAA